MGMHNNYHKTLLQNEANNGSTVQVHFNCKYTDKKNKYKCTVECNDYHENTPEDCPLTMKYSILLIMYTIKN
jgi:hypothetical protein